MVKELRIKSSKKIHFKLSILLMFLVTIGILFIQIGYATLNSTLTISSEAKINQPFRKLLYAPFDGIGETIESEILLYAPMDGVGYANENYQPSTDPMFIDAITNIEFNRLGGNITHSTTQAKLGNQSAYFSGLEGQRLNSNIASMNLGTTDFTVSFWVKPDIQTMGYVSLFGNDGNDNFQMFLNDESSSGNISLLIGYERILNTGKKYSPDIWTHYAVVRKDGVFTVYENGVNIGSTNSYVTTPITMASFSIGGNASVSNTAYKGYLDDIAIYNYAKWNNDFTPSEIPQTDANLLYMNFEETLPNIMEYTKQPISEIISNSNFTILGNAYIEGRDNTYKFGGSSLYFPGTSGQRININVSNLNLGVTDFTVSFWLKPEIQTVGYVSLFGNDGNNNFQMFLNDADSGGNISLLIGTTRILNTEKKYTPNVWTHYAIVRKDGVFTVYENGINIGSLDSYVTTPITMTSFSIGGNASIGNTQYKGYMDDFVIYNYAKYTNNFTPPSEDAINDPDNQQINKLTIKDIITNNNFTTLGSARLSGTNSEKKYGEASLYFPGTVAQRININAPNLNLGTTDFTVSFWVKPDIQTMGYVSLFGNDGNDNFQMFLNDEPSSGNISLLIGYERILNTGKKYSPDIWTHYAVVRKDGVFTVYENGVNIGSTNDYVNRPINMTNFSIGGNASTGNTAYKGYIDDFVIYNKAIYDDNFSPPTEAAGEKDSIG